MKKKISLFVLCGIVLLGVCGCGNKGKDEEVKIKNLKIGNLDKISIVCDEIKDIVDISLNGDYFITTNGELYKLNVRQLFSNNKNCQKIDTNIKATKFYRSDVLEKNYVLGEDNEMYDIRNNSLTIADEESFHIIEISLLNKEQRKNIFMGDDEVYYYNEKNIYSTNLVDKLHYEISDKVILSLDEDEELIYAFDNSIKTTKRLYIYDTKTINEEECTKYADVKCETKGGWYEVDDNIKKQLSNIVIYKYDFAVDKNGNFYANLNNM